MKNLKLLYQGIFQHLLDMAVVINNIDLYNWTLKSKY